MTAKSLKRWIVKAAHLCDNGGVIGLLVITSVFLVEPAYVCEGEIAHAYARSQPFDEGSGQALGTLVD